MRFLCFCGARISFGYTDYSYGWQKWRKFFESQSDVMSLIAFLALVLVICLVLSIPFAAKNPNVALILRCAVILILIRLILEFL